MGPQISKQIPQIVDRLQSLRQTNLLGNPYLVGKTTLGQLLDTAALAKEKQTVFAKALADNTEPLEKFWATLADGKHGFTTEEVSAVRQTLSIGAFVKNTLPLVTAIRQKFSAGTYKSLPDLAKLSEQDWADLIKAGGAGAVPTNITGTDPAGTFAREIYDRVTAAYPTAALSARTASFVPQPHQQPVSRFFGNNAVLDLRRENLDIYLNKAGEAAFSGIAQADRPVVVGHVRAMQRVLRIVPHVDVCQKLLSVGLDSAAAITMTGKRQFVAKLGAAGVAELDATKTYDLARTRHAASLSLFTRFNRGLRGPWPKAFGPPLPDNQTVEGAVAQNATLAVLFGPQDFCEVDDCTSILSPAAYLTDLFLWLSNRSAGVTKFSSALEALKSRRPDLVHLLLNCPNTDTTLPYVDLVNELLADTISPPKPAQWRQTTLTAAELRAAPDPSNMNPTADQQLLKAVFPHTLPYNPALDQLRTVLAQSNVALWQVRQAFLPLHGAPPAATMLSIAAERFGISAAERALITTPNAADPKSVWATGAPATDLAKVSTFLTAAGLTYEQLLELIDVKWACGGGKALAITGATDTCETDSQTLAPLDLTRLDLIHRFLRLWRRTGWKMWELDLLLSAAAIGDPTLAPSTLINLFQFRLLQDATRLSVVQLLAFYQNIDTASHRDPDGTATTPLYATLFTNPALVQDPELQLPKLGPTADLPAHAPAIQAALQRNADDTATLIGLTDGKRTLENLSLTYRVATLAQALRLSLADLQTIGPQPLTGVFTSAATTLAFVQRATDVAHAGFSVDQLSYVLTVTPAKSGITDAQVKSVIADVVAAMQKVHQAVYGPGDPPLAALAREFAQLPPPADPSQPNLTDPGVAKTALSIVDGSFTGGDPARTNFINTQFSLFMTTAELAGAIATLTPLPKAATGDALDGRANLVLTPLARYLTQTKVIAVVGADLALAADVTAYLVGKLTVPHAPPSNETLLQALTDPQLLANPAPAAVLTAAQNAIRLLHKLSIVITRLHLVRADLGWLIENASVYGGLALANLPVVPGQSAVGRLAAGHGLAGAAQPHIHRACELDGFPAAGHHATDRPDQRGGDGIDCRRRSCPGGVRRDLRRGPRRRATDGRRDRSLAGRRRLA